MSGDHLRIFATVGTDHHPFDRLVSWLDRWLEVAPRSARVSALVQTGTSSTPRHAEATPYLAFADLRAALARADVVVCHGGPATIVEARLAGHRPLVVPRRGDLGEHVDDHQVRFTTRIAASGAITLVDGYEALASALDAALASPGAHRTAISTDTGNEAVDRFREAVDPLLSRRRRAA